MEGADAEQVLKRQFPDAACNPDTGLSKRASKKLAKKQRKKAYKQAEGPNDSRRTEGFAGEAAGKAGRARAARMGISIESTRAAHRPRGGAPVTVLPEHRPIVQALELVEGEARLAHHPHMKERATVPMDCHGSMEVAQIDESQDAVNQCRMRSLALRQFDLQQLSAKALVDVSQLTMLDVSRNELWEVAGLETLTGLIELDISRNWFRELPRQVGQLPLLQTLNASHNVLMPSPEALALTSLASLPNLRMLDLTFNQKCGKKRLSELLNAQLPLVDARVTLAPSYHDPAPEGAFEGDSAADRDATLLRAQLEPWSTTALRRRLVADFGQPVSDPASAGRAEVMKELLGQYEAEGSRKVVHVDGCAVSESMCAQLLEELQQWAQAARLSGLTRERPSIKAESYMILTLPSEFAAGSTKAHNAAAKLCEHKRIWDLAQQAMASVDPVFAKRYTAVAVTSCFSGSPHIDKQNVAPFWGLALGDFEDGQGQIVVECSARVVAKVNTKNRLGRVDGRYPHWVAPYDDTCSRYSLIYYATAGEMQPVGPAIFDVPTEAPIRR